MKRIRPPAPGEVLGAFLKRKGITQDALAVAMHVSRFSVNQLCVGKRNVTPAMALRLSKALSTSAEFWLALQQNCDLFDAEQRAAPILKSVRVLRHPEMEFVLDGRRLAGRALPSVLHD